MCEKCDEDGFKSIPTQEQIKGWLEDCKDAPIPLSLVFHNINGNFEVRRYPASSIEEIS